MNTGNSSYGKLDEKIYTNLTSDHPIDLARYQVLNCYSGKIPLINSGGGSGDNDLHDAVRSSVINKKAGGSGLIMGRKAFQREMEEGVEILKAVQSVYLCKEVGLS
jgi:class I fructose-bisphosphate aldolase